jgi:methylthioribulose-1-phosphate dehydratase
MTTKIIELSSNERKNLIEIIHSFHQKGWSPATSTNYSFLNPQPYSDTITISMSGIDKSKFEDKHLLILDLKSKQLLPEYANFRSSAETAIHLALYKNPNVKAVLHTHSIANTVVSLKAIQQKGIELKGFEMLKALEGIKTHETNIWLPIFENSQDMDEFSKNIELYLSQHPQTYGFLMRGHGLYTWGQSLDQAKRHIETLEFMLECMMYL